MNLKVMLDALRGSVVSVAIIRSEVPFEGREGSFSISPRPIFMNSAWSC